MGGLGLHQFTFSPKGSNWWNPLGGLHTVCININLTLGYFWVSQIYCIIAKLLLTPPFALNLLAQKAPTSEVTWLSLGSLVQSPLGFTCSLAWLGRLQLVKLFGWVVYHTQIGILFNKFYPNFVMFSSTNT
jgi:hypothetical protein